MSNDITQEGSTVLSDSGDISYEAGNDIVIKAGENSYTSTEKSESYNASYAYGTGGYSANAGFSLGGSTTDDIWHTNSVVRADGGTVSMKTGQRAGSKGDMTLSGANILGKNVDIDVKGNLRQESLQDTHRTDGKTVGMNAGISGGTKLSSAVSKYNTGQEGSTGLSGVSIGGHYGQTKEDSAWVNQQTSIVGSESVNINVGGKYSNKGAVIANADYAVDNNGNIEYSNDKGNLTLNAKEFEYEDIEDHDYRNSYRYGGQVSLGKFDKEGSFAQNLGSGAKNSTVTGTFYNKGSEKEQITRATVGQGTIIVDSKVMTDNDLPGLNRDITKSQEVTRDQITNALDAEVTVDVRLMTSVAGAILSKDKGVKDISVVQDALSIKNSVNEVLESLGVGASAKKAAEEAAKREAFKKKMSEETEKMRTDKKAKAEARDAYIKNCIENRDVKGALEATPDVIKNDKKLMDDIALKAYKAIENAPITEKERQKYIDLCKKYEAELLAKKSPTCSSTSGAKVTEEGGYLPYAVEVINPSTGKKKTIWYNANAQNDYFETSPYWEKIPRLPDGTLDHATANEHSNGGIVEFSYKNPTGKEGHTATVIYTDDMPMSEAPANSKNPQAYYNTQVTMVYSYNAKQKKVETTPLDVQVSKVREDTSEYYIYTGPIIGK